MDRRNDRKGIRSRRTRPRCHTVKRSDRQRKIDEAYSRNRFLSEPLPYICTSRRSTQVDRPRASCESTPHATRASKARSTRMGRAPGKAGLRNYAEPFNETTKTNNVDIADAISTSRTETLVRESRKPTSPVFAPARRARRGSRRLAARASCQRSRLRGARKGAVEKNRAAVAKASARDTSSVDTGKQTHHRKRGRSAKLQARYRLP